MFSANFTFFYFFLKKMFDNQKSPVYKAALCNAEELEKPSKTTL